MSSPSSAGQRGASGAPHERRLGRRRWLLAASGGLLASLALACRAPPPPAFGSGLGRVPASGSVRERERAMIARLNRDRAARGLPALHLDERLSEIARHHSRDMRDNHFFEHESPRTGGVDNRLDAGGYAFVTARENLSEAPDINRGQDGLLASPPHHANIMSSDVTHVGIGIVEGGVVDPRNLTITQVFARPAVDEPPERARRRTLERLDRERAAQGHARARRDAKLMQLAERHLAEVDPQADAESVERAGRAIASALAGQPGAVMISAQVVPGADQVSFPSALLESPRCAVGLAVRRTTGERGRPALLLLMLARQEGRR